jgi:uncharacterized protein YqhQ
LPAPGSSQTRQKSSPPGDAPVGGQAVLEGVMMRGVRTWALAVRLPTPDQLALRAARSPVPAGPIDVRTFALESPLRRHRALRLPVVRGVVALAESLRIGVRALGLAAAAQLPADEQEVSGGVWAGTIALALAFAVGLFFVAPVGLTSLIGLRSSAVFWLVEGLVRTTIFLGYLAVLSRLRELRRVFEYHGAEHKAIACYEAGDPLTPENAQRQSRLHPRCGTSFLLIVMIIAIFVFAPIGLPAWYWLVATRILGVPLIAGLAYEVIRLAARHRRHRWVRALMSPGLALQRLTTREPDLGQLAVAIAALDAVLRLEPDDSAEAGALIGLEVVA